MNPGEDISLGILHLNFSILVYNMKLVDSTRKYSAKDNSKLYLYIFFFFTQQPAVGQGLLIQEVSRSVFLNLCGTAAR